MVNYDEIVTYADEHGIDMELLNTVIDSPAVSVCGPNDDIVFEDGYIPASSADAVEVLLEIVAWWNND